MDADLAAAGGHKQNAYFPEASHASPVALSRYARLSTCSKSLANTAVVSSGIWAWALPGLSRTTTDNQSKFRAAWQGQLFDKTSQSKRQKLSTYSKRGSRDHHEAFFSTEDGDSPIASSKASPHLSTSSAPRSSPPPRFRSISTSTSQPEGRHSSVEYRASPSRHSGRSETPSCTGTTDQVMTGTEPTYPDTGDNSSPSAGAPLSDSSNRPHSQIARIGTTLGRSSSPAKRSHSERVAIGEEADLYDNGIDTEGDDGVRRSPSKRTNASHAQSPLPDRSKRPLDMKREPTGDTIMNEDDISPHATGSTASDGNDVPRSSPPSSVETPSGEKVTTSLPSYDEQYQQIMPLVMTMEMSEGQVGYLVPTEWLLRVLSRTGEGLMNHTYPKEARMGEIGAIDTRPLVSVSANFESSGLKDAAGDDFVPLKSGMRVGEDFEVFQKAGWDQMVEWYGLATGSPSITRIAHNTNVDSDTQPNFQLELYPPLFTIQKVQNEARGLESIGDAGKPAVRMVASRSDQYQGFLKRMKEALEIPMHKKVQVWKVIETLQTVPGRAGIPTPSSSRDPSPAPQLSLASDVMKLAIDKNTLSAMPEGTRRELLSFKDETMNSKYNGHLTLGQVGFPEAQALIVEEDSREASAVDVRTAFQDKTSINGTNKTAVSNALDRPSANTRGTRSSSPFVLSERGCRDKKGKFKGSNGLTNLGNTCYMNSALQCLRSVDELTVYFLRQKHKLEINSDNPLGHGGQIANAYAGLMHNIFTTESSHSPRVFKQTLGRCQPLFSGYGQQDSQEFLSFLIDGLHEDLNRIHKKPYIENPDSDDKTVHDPIAIQELGETYRSNHHKRNDSVAMDLFSGFYKNTMVCPECDKVSVTFDPYSQVTLQLPIEDAFSHQIRMVPLRDVPQLVDVDVGKNTTIRGLKDYIAKRFPGIKAQNIVLAENYNEKFYRIFEDAETLSELSIAENEKIYAFELEDSPSNWPPLDKKKTRSKPSFLNISPLSNQDTIPDMSSPFADRMAIPVYHRVPRGTGRSGFTLYPFFIMVTRDEARDYETIFRKLLIKIAALTTRDIFANCELASAQHSDADTGEAESDPKVQAKSVEGDDDLVDVSMTNSGDDPAKTVPKASVDRQSRILDHSTFIDGELRNFFDIGVFSTSQQEIIPLGFTGVNETSKWPLLRDRVVRQPRRRPSANSWLGRKDGTNRSGGWSKEPSSESESEDELTSSEAGLQRKKPAIQEPDGVESDEDSQSTTEQGRSPSRKPVSSRSGSRIRAKWNKFGKTFKRSQSRSNSKEDYLLRLGEGLILDWNTVLFDSLFCGEDAEDFKGQRTDLNIAVVPDPELEARRAKRSSRKKKGVTLDECFAETAKSEILSEENTWYCNRCKEMRRASKTLELWTVPDILIVHLKRFSSQSRLRDKVDILVDFPVEGLDLTDKVGLPEGRSLVYDLFAVDNHYGGLGGGHYTAVAKNIVDKEWYDYNDAFVSKTTGAHAVTKSAYLLFYRRRQDQPLGPPYLQELARNVNCDSRSPSPAGKDGPGDHSSFNGSPVSSQALGGSNARNREPGRAMLGGAGGSTHQEGALDDDEAIDISADDPVQSMEGPPAYRSGFGSTWSFDNIKKSGTEAPQSSVVGNKDDSSGTLAEDDTASDKVAVSDLDDRMDEDFPVEERTPFIGGQMGKSASGVDEDEAFVESIGMTDDVPVDDDKVAEVRLSDDERL